VSDTRDLTNDEVAALEPWQRVAFFIQPFNSVGLRFANAQEWAEWASILRHETAEELIDEHECLTEFVERENAALRAELEGVRKDAERYRHVRNNPAMLLHLSNRDFDAAIDAAIAKEGK